MWAKTTWTFNFCEWIENGIKRKKLKIKNDIKY